MHVVYKATSNTDGRADVNKGTHTASSIAYKMRLVLMTVDVPFIYLSHSAMNNVITTSDTGLLGDTSFDSNKIGTIKCQK